MARIGIDARLTYYRVGGISTYIRRFISALEKTQTEHQFTIFHSKKSAEKLVQRFGSATLWTPSHHRLEKWALSVELASKRLDLWHSPDFIPPLRGARRHVITVHDLTFIHYPQYLTAEARQYYNKQIKWAVTHADHILCDSEATKQDLMALLNVSPDKITVHMLGVDESFRPQDDAHIATIQRALGLPPNYFLFVGTFEPRKNIIGLLHAYHDLKTKSPDAPKLVLVGKRGWLFTETMSTIETLNLDQHIIWRDNVTDEQLPAVYSGAIALITPSFYEGFGLPALEAMACGTVPIVSDRSSLPEITGDVGLLINPDDPITITTAMMRAWTDLEWRAQNERAAITRAKQFTWEHTAHIISQIYELLL